MSIAGIAFSNLSTYSAPTNFQQIRQDFNQLGQDLLSGNLSAAQQDFTALQQLNPSVSSSSTSQSSNPISQQFNQLAQDLSSGNLSAAQKDYSTIQQDFQGRATQAHHHHHHGGGSSEINQLLNQLGQDLQSGDLSSAQQAYTSMMQDFQNFTQVGSATSSQPSSLWTSGAVSVSA